MGRGRLQEAASCFEEAVAADGTQGHYRVYRGYLRFQFVDAVHRQTRLRLLDEMRAALFDCQARDDCTVLVARAYAETGQTDVAVKLCRRALALNPECEGARELLSTRGLQRHAG
jgi:tetratricopeptide (TPR) repeat protein